MTRTETGISSWRAETTHSLTGEKAEKHPNETKCCLHVREKGIKVRFSSRSPCMIEPNVSRCVHRGITGNPTGWTRRGATFGYQMSKQCYPRLADVLRRCVWRPRALAAALPLSNARFFGFSSFFKGVEAKEIVLSILPNKREHTQAGLDSHLKTLYSLTLVLLFSLSFSQWRPGQLTACDLFAFWAASAK